MSEGKLIRHTCGYPLWSYVFSVFDDNVVVHYRSGAPHSVGILVYACPKCHQPLQMWWKDPTGEQARKHAAILRQGFDDLV